MAGPFRGLLAVVTALLMAGSDALSQGVRDHTRLTPGLTRDRRATVSETQATELTLTVASVSVRPIQTWVRTAGVIDGAQKTITASVSAAERALITVGQRVRAFPPESRSSMFQAKVTGIRPTGSGAEVRAQLAGPAREGSTRYVLEIVTDRGDFLSIPNEAIIEAGGTHLVYAQMGPGRYEPKNVQLGVQGELYTQVIGGLEAGTQVVTVGSFFVDANYKLKDF
jgi:Cu(I)/Ag(I) efflux system membrane fusion protein